MKTSFSMIVLAGVSLLSYSCQEDLTLRGGEEKAKKEVLVFRDSHALEQAINQKKTVDSYGGTLAQDANGLSPQSLRSVSESGGSISYSDLVPEKDFRVLLNQNGEIQVGDTMYCIAPAGTFYTHKDNIQELRTVVKTYDESKAVRTDDRNLSIGNVTLFETFKTAGFTGVDQPDPNFGPEEGGGMPNDSPEDPQEEPDSPIVDTFFGIPNPNLDSFPRERASRRTKVGKVFQNIGIMKSLIREFRGNNRRRLNCSVFDYNYVLRHSIGVTAKVQKKMWYGGWAKVENWSKGHIRVGYRNVLVRYSYPNLMQRVKTMIERAGSHAGSLPFDLRDRQKTQEYIMSLPYPSWYKKMIGTIQIPIIDFRKDLTYGQIYDMLIPELKRFVKSLKNPGSQDDGRYSYGPGPLQPEVLTSEEKRILAIYPAAMPVYAPDGIYIFYTSGWYANEDRNDQGEVTLRFSDGIGTIQLGVQVKNPAAPKFSPTLAIESAEQTGDLIFGDFFACAYMNHEWVGYNLYW